jgi:immune inhibitor A
LRRLLVVVTTLALAASIPVTTAAAKKGTLPNYSPGPVPAWVTSTTPDMSRLQKITPADRAAAASTAGQGGNPAYAEGDQLYGLVLNDYLGGYQLATYTVRAIGQHIEVWVQDNLDFPAGDPRNPVTVTDDQIAYLVDQFDNNIYPKESEFWRMPATRDGSNAILDDLLGLPSDYYQSSDGQDRVIAMISNVRDDSYYDSTFPVYIAGFFSPTINLYFDRNVITIDAYDWGNRVGPEGSPWRPNDGSGNDRPYLYESTFAHEYQHLLHNDQDPGEATWVNEGLSDWTEWLVGYGIPNGHWDTAQQYAENSLVVWGDQGQGTEILADYGEAFMFMHYLYQQHGEAAMQALFQDPLHGIAGVNDALASIGSSDTFAELYHNFAIARLVLANKGNYKLRDIPSPVVLNSEAYSTPGAPPWGSDYLRLDNPKKITAINFDGVDMITKATAWSSVADPVASNGDVLYSGQGDEVDRWAIFANPGGSTLSFDTLYDIEDGWDYGFVMASSDNGATWTALTNGDTVNYLDPSGYPTIAAILDAGGEGFTGSTGGWATETFSIPAGTDLIAFRFMSDWATNGNGNLADPNWYVDNVMVDATSISDGSNAADFKDITYYNPTKVDFNVDLVSMPSLHTFNSSTKVLHLITDDATEVATASQIKRQLRASNVLVLIVTYDAPQGVSDYADYTLSIDY